jgi:hypothetical protein
MVPGIATLGPWDCYLGARVCYLGVGCCMRSTLLPWEAGSTILGGDLCYLGNPTLLCWCHLFSASCIRRPALLPWEAGSTTLGGSLCYLLHPALLRWRRPFLPWASSGRCCYLGRLALLPWAATFATLGTRLCYVGVTFFLPRAFGARRCCKQQAMLVAVAGGAARRRWFLRGSRDVLRISNFLCNQEAEVAHRQWLRDGDVRRHQHAALVRPRSCLRSCELQMRGDISLSMLIKVKAMASCGSPGGHVLSARGGVSEASMPRETLSMPLSKFSSLPVLFYVQTALPCTHSCLLPTS